MLFQCVMSLYYIIMYDFVLNNIRVNNVNVFGNDI